MTSTVDSWRRSKSTNARWDLREDLGRRRAELPLLRAVALERAIEHVSAPRFRRLGKLVAMAAPVSFASHSSRSSTTVWRRATSTATRRLSPAT
jgi:hypothetical protein